MPIIKTNIILVSPYIILITSKFLIPQIYGNIRRKVYWKRSVPKDHFLEKYEELSDSFNEFSKKYQKMLTYSGDRIVIPGEVQKQAAVLEKKFKYFKKLPSKQDVNDNNLSLTTNNSEIDRTDDEYDIVTQKIDFD